MPKPRQAQAAVVAGEADRLASVRTDLARVREAVGRRTMLARSIDLHLARAEGSIRESELRLRSVANAGSEA